MKEIKEILKDCTELHTERFGLIDVQFADLNVDKATAQLQALFDKRVREMIDKIIEFMEGKEYGGFEKVQTDWKCRNAPDRYNMINQVYQEDWESFKKALKSKYLGKK